jgi:hypothetical protein
LKKWVPVTFGHCEAPLQVLCALPRPVWPTHRALCTPVWSAERTVWPQTASRIHTWCIKGRGTSPSPPQRLPWPQSANVYDDTHKHTHTTFALIYRTSGYPRPSVKNFDIKKMKKNNTGIGPIKWNCLVHTNKIVPKKKRKGRKKKDGYENNSKYFSTQKKKISMLLIFSNSQISNNSRSEPSEVTGFPFSSRSI